MNNKLINERRDLKKEMFRYPSDSKEYKALKRKCMDIKKKIIGMYDKKS